MRAILFDLDGTLLPMDEEAFTKGYFKFLCKKAAPLGYKPEELINAIWTGMAAMVKNDGAVSNEQRFWDKFASIFGEEKRKDSAFFLDFYQNEFNQAVQFTSPNPALVQEIVALAHQKADLVILATNPIFPIVATENRINWAGAGKEDFAFITTYENCNYCKPNPLYYQAILDKFDLKGEDCLMVGNDVREDIVPTASLGMKNYLVTDCLINKDNLDLPEEKGSLESVLEVLKAL